MITTVTLNPCIDKTMKLRNFHIGATHKVLGVDSHIGGKGINVSIVLKQLGVTTECLGFHFCEAEMDVRRFLSEQGIGHDFTDAAGKLRTNIKIFDEAAGVMTECNERGSCVDKQSVELLYSTIEKHLNQCDILVAGGSAPAGVSEDIYCRILELANMSGVKCILDASGEQLVQGIKAKPFLIKPNRDEFEQAFHKSARSINEAVSASRDIIAQGVSFVCMSMGREGALLTGGKTAFFAPGLDVEVKGIQGAGDSLVAGMCSAMVNKLGPEEILRWGMAAASGSLLHEGTKLCQRQDFDRLLGRVKIISV